MTLFFDDEDSHVKTKETFAISTAKKLHKFIISNKWAKGRISLSKWVKDIEKLQKKESKEEITAILDWFINNHEQIEIPLFSAGGFVMYFNTIRNKRKGDLSTVVISANAKQIADHFRGEFWPMGSDKDLDAVIELSMQNFRVFRAKLVERMKWLEKQLESKTITDKRLNWKYDTQARFIHWLLEQKLGPIYAFTENWVDFIQEKIAGWDGWSGKLQSMIWKVDSDHFHRIGLHYAYEYSANSRLWDDLVKVLEKESENGND